MGTILVREVPEDLRRAFKAVCAQRGLTMQGEILRLMAEEVKRAEGKKR